MSDDLNQAIEHINEVAKNQSSDDPVRVFFFFNLKTFAVFNYLFADFTNCENFECPYELFTMDW